MSSFFKDKKQTKTQPHVKATPEIDQINAQFSSNLEENIETFKKALSNPSDLNTRNITIFDLQATVVFIDTMSDRMDVQKVIDDLIKSKLPLEQSLQFSFKTYTNPETVVRDCVYDILAGYAFLFLDGKDTPYSFMARKHEGRAVAPPINEQVVRGSHEGLVESLETNLFLIRKNIVSPSLTVQKIEVGKEAQKAVSIVYLTNLADETLVEDIKTRINSIDIDTPFSISYIENFIEEYTISPFPQCLTTERVDRIAGNLMEGRIAILVEGSPTALIVPVSFFAFYQSPDDYNTRFMIGSFYRLIRYIASVVAILLPATYIALIGFHSETLPSYLIFLAKKSVETIPYGPIVEAIIVEIFIGFIREASLRLPTKISSAIGIVGALIIGDAIVQAGLVSNLMVVIVALTAISSFTIPASEMSLTVRILRFPFMILAAFLGFYGILIGLFVLVGHLCKLQPFGIPYLAPLTPIKWKDFKDTFARVPIILMNERPVESRTKNIIRQGFSRWWKKE